MIDHEDLPDTMLVRQLNEKLEALNFDDEGMQFTGLTLHPAPDGRFSIFNLSWESCGAYCNPWNELLVRFENGDKRDYTNWEDVAEWQMLAIDSILLLDKDSSLYLIMGNSWGRPRGIEGVYSVDFCMVKLDDNYLDLRWGHSATDSNMAHDEENESEPGAEMIFHHADSSISYRSAGYQESDPWTYTRESGRFKFDSQTRTFVETEYMERWWINKN
ncbi:MAG: hypothetical protein R3B47_00485 [Bacteroidia bacterium]